MMAPFVRPCWALVALLLLVVSPLVASFTLNTLDSQQRYRYACNGAAGTQDTTGSSVGRRELSPSSQTSNCGARSRTGHIQGRRFRAVELNRNSPLHMNSKDDSTSEGGNSSNSNNEDPFRGVPPPPPPLSPPQASPSQTPRLDPLFAAMTRSDPTAASTKPSPTTTVPILGEVTLDRSLFLLVPLIGFAVGGFILSLYVLANSGDVALLSTGSTPLPPPVVVAEDGACRGLCSSQQQDLEGMRVFLTNFGK